MLRYSCGLTSVVSHRSATELVGVGLAVFATGALVPFALLRIPSSSGTKLYTTTGARTHLRHESLLVARGLVFIEPLHLGDVGHLRDECLCASVH